LQQRINIHSNTKLVGAHRRAPCPITAQPLRAKGYSPLAPLSPGGRGAGGEGVIPLRRRLIRFPLQAKA